jgi:sugar lactone lactonase YvrE
MGGAPVSDLVPELIVDARCAVGEGPVWDASAAALLWVDIPAGIVHRHVPASGMTDSTAVGQPVGAVVPCASGELLLGLRDGIARLTAFDADAVPSLLVGIETDRPENRLNDGKCDPQGRFWIGTMADPPIPGAGSLYRLDADLSLTLAITSATISNGLGWSPDGTLMYFIDSPTHGVDMLDFDPVSGCASGRRRLVSTPDRLGLPDGMAVDAEGGLWVAFWGGGVIRRYSSDGKFDAEVAFPAAQVSSCAFGGDDLSDLYVTTAAIGLSEAGHRETPHAGGLFRVRPGVRGLATTLFAG